MARLSRKDFSASCRLPWATSTSPTLLYETERSRCHPALPGSALARRSAMARAGGKVFSAACRLPCATITSPTLLDHTERKRCVYEFPGDPLGSWTMRRKAEVDTVR